MRLRLVPALTALAVLAGCTTTAATTGPATQAPTPTAATPARSASPATTSPARATTPSRPTVVAFIADYGNCDEGQQAVADMVDSWQVAAIVTGGDNTQDESGCTAYTQSVKPYFGEYFADPDAPRFFPALGNHDYDNATAGLAAYSRTFPYLPTDADPHGRWYEQTIGSLTFFVLDSEAPAGDQNAQRAWLRQALDQARDDRPDSWRVVVAHRPPYSSGTQGSWEALQASAGWELAAWGADLVLSGHQHIYEDVVVDGLHHITGTTGASEKVRPCGQTRVEGSRVCIEGEGALRVEATDSRLTVELHHPQDEAIKDRVTLVR